MKKLIFICWLTFLTLTSAGCQKEKTDMQVTYVAYSADSGPVTPEMQWHEEVHISLEKVEFTRAGKSADSLVNAGSWTAPAGRADIEALFRRLESVDCAKMTRVEPSEPPDGGGTRSFMLGYANGKTCSLYYDPGADYAHGEEIILPIEHFIANILLPEAARARIKP